MRSHPCDLPPIEYGPHRFQHRVEWMAFQGLGLSFRLLPLFLIRVLLQGLILLGKIVFKKRMTGALLTIVERLGVSEEKARGILDHSLMNFGLNWVCQFRPEVFVQPGRIHVEGMEHLEKHHASGRGMVIAAMHLGLWEAVPQAMKQLGLPLAITVAVQHNPLIDRILNQKRTAGGFHHILHNRLGIRHTLRYLKGGGTLIVLADVDIGPGGTPIPFLGRPASTPKWPMELALRTGSELIVGFTRIDQDGNLHLHFRPVSEGENETMDLGGRMNDEMSKTIREYPEQWFWMQRRWKTPIEQCRSS